LRGLEYAIKLKWFDVRNFNLRDYEFYERVENGDLNWTVPQKFVSFSGPSPTPKDSDGVFESQYNKRCAHLRQKTMFPFSSNSESPWLFVSTRKHMRATDLLRMASSMKKFIS
jgi:hypothetical protein